LAPSYISERTNHVEAFSDRDRGGERAASVAGERGKSPAADPEAGLHPAAAAAESLPQSATAAAPGAEADPVALQAGWRADPAHLARSETLTRRGNAAGVGIRA
jgi:hypothetical protein